MGEVAETWVAIPPVSDEPIGDDASHVEVPPAFYDDTPPPPPPPDDPHWREWFGGEPPPPPRRDDEEISDRTTLRWIMTVFAVTVVLHAIAGILLVMLARVG